MKRGFKIVKNRSSGVNELTWPLNVKKNELYLETSVVISYPAFNKHCSKLGSIPMRKIVINVYVNAGLGNKKCEKE